MLAFIVPGTALGYFYSLSLPILAASVILSLVLLLGSFFPKSRLPFIIPLGILLFVMSLWQANLKYYSPPHNDIAAHVGLKENIRFFGSIDKWPVLKRHRTQITCRVDSIVLSGQMQSASGLLMIQLQRESTRFSLGDKISFTGRLNLPARGNYPGRFDYSRYLQTKGISGIVYIGNPALISLDSQKQNFAGQSINDIRQWILDCFYTNMRELPAALAAGFLVGETHEIPPEIYQAFRRTGTMHLLAVSGSNVVLVLIVIGWLLKFIPVGRYGRFALMIVVIVAFSHLSYNQPSVVRASVMVALVMAGRVFFRRIDLSNIIALAASGLIFYDPANLFDIGFQLSFAVTWGLVLFLPKLNRLFEDREMGTALRYLLLVLFSSVIASLIAAPITMFYFGQVPLITVLSNLFIVPLVSVAVIGIVILLLINLAWPAVAIAPGMLLDRLLNLINQLVMFFGDWKITMLELPSISIYLIILYIGGLFLLFNALTSIPLRRLAIFYILACLLIYSAVDILSGPSQDKRIEIFNRGSYQTLVIDFEDGLVITNQNRTSRYDDFNTNLLPYLADRKKPLPTSFAFFEPAYKTKQKISKASEGNDQLEFKPVGNPPNSGYPSIWQIGDISKADIESQRFMELSEDAIGVRFSDGSEILFCKSPQSWLKFRHEYHADSSYHFIIAQSDADMRLIEANIDAEDAKLPLILLSKPRQSYNFFTNNAIQDDLGWLYDLMIDKGEYLVIPVT